jgi:hypothetical protein
MPRDANRAPRRRRYECPILDEQFLQFHAQHWCSLRTSCAWLALVAVSTCDGVKPGAHNWLSFSFCNSQKYGSNELSRNSMCISRARCARYLLTRIASAWRKATTHVEPACGLDGFRGYRDAELQKGSRFSPGPFHSQNACIIHAFILKASPRETDRKFKFARRCQEALPPCLIRSRCR